MKAILCVLVLSASAFADGKAVFLKSCSQCHGADGVAKPAIAKMMKVDIKNLGSKEVKAMSDADIKKVITAGKGKMKPIASVQGSDVDAVVAFVRTLK